MIKHWQILSTSFCLSSSHHVFTVRVLEHSDLRNAFNAHVDGASFHDAGNHLRSQQSLTACLVCSNLMRIKFFSQHVHHCSLTIPACAALGKSILSALLVLQPCPIHFHSGSSFTGRVLILGALVAGCCEGSIIRQPEAFKKISLLKQFKSDIPETTCEIDHLGSL